MATLEIKKKNKCEAPTDKSSHSRPPRCALHPPALPVNPALWPCRVPHVNSGSFQTEFISIGLLFFFPTIPHPLLPFPVRFCARYSSTADRTIYKPLPGPIIINRESASFSHYISMTPRFR